MAAIGASTTAKRLALAYVLFKVIAALIAIQQHDDFGELPIADEVGQPRKRHPVPQPPRRIRPAREAEQIHEGGAVAVSRAHQ